MPLCNKHSLLPNKGIPIKSNPINIKNKNMEEFSLHNKIFNPSKSSPPNDWNIRLNKRYNEINNNQDMKEFEKQIKNINLEIKL